MGGQPRETFVTRGPNLDSRARASRSQELFGKRLLMHHWLMWCELNSRKSFFTKSTPARLPNSLNTGSSLYKIIFWGREEIVSQESKWLMAHTASSFYQLFLHIFAAFVGSLQLMLQYDFLMFPHPVTGWYGVPTTPDPYCWISSYIYVDI